MQCYWYRKLPHTPGTYQKIFPSNSHGESSSFINSWLGVMLLSGYVKQECLKLEPTNRKPFFLNGRGIRETNSTIFKEWEAEFPFRAIIECGREALFNQPGFPNIQGLPASLFTCPSAEDLEDSPKINGVR